MQEPEPAAGVLYLVGTPIGNLGDFSPRARQVLAGVDRIACEDTRRAGLLLQALGLRQKLVSFHQHNQTTRIPQLLEELRSGGRLALISDAGLPGISDPGEPLVAAARAEGLEVICVPGPCALTTALVSSGLPSGRFCFEGFLPARSRQRRARLEELRQEPRTLVLYEAPHRLVDLLEDLLEVLGDRPLQVGRELTKRHEQQVGPSVSAALAHFRQVPPQGECTLVLGGAEPPAAPEWSEAELRQQLQGLVEAGRSRREAARELAERTGLSRRELYGLLHRQEADPDAAAAEAAAEAEAEAEAETESETSDNGSSESNRVGNGSSNPPGRK